MTFALTLPYRISDPLWNIAKAPGGIAARDQANLGLPVVAWLDKNVGGTVRNEIGTWPHGNGWTIDYVAFSEFLRLGVYIHRELDDALLTEFVLRFS